MPNILLCAALSTLLLAPNIAVAACHSLPDNISYRNGKLPNPFMFYNGSKVAMKTDWECRRQEIIELFQRTEYGILPPKPSSVTGSLDGSTLTVDVTHEGKAISFTADVNIPSSDGPVPALIALAASSLPPLPGVATIVFKNDEIAVQDNLGSRGRGKFFTIYGAKHSAGALMAWTWGVSRIIDVLEQLPSSPFNIKKLAVTGCSRNARGVMAIGAFEPRIALTLPQESGSGGSGCWRITDAIPNSGIVIPNSTLTASQIVQNNVWFSTWFNQYGLRVPELPTDHHLLAALIAPRAVLVIENSSVGFLLPQSSWGCMKASRKVFEALGVPDRMGISFVGGHNHCQYPTSQNPELLAFVDKFLWDRGANTTIVRTDDAAQFGYKEYNWVDWVTPTLT